MCPARTFREGGRSLWREGTTNEGEQVSAQDEAQSLGHLCEGTKLAPSRLGSLFMKLAVPVSGGRVSTAFDFARQLLLLEVEDGREVRRTELVLEEETPLSRARRLQYLGVKVLICGAISRLLTECLASAGINVIPLVSGQVEEVLKAYLAGQLDSARFLMPGSTVEERREWRVMRGLYTPAALMKGKKI